MILFQKSSKITYSLFPIFQNMEKSR
ncbi:hypothetical protein CY0110_16867 [Crocosphaera chwakensis CCY0110]|uniref:Uncharacterized protein n=1 Tax=Crocosphaera chwakensis CCY0110 TaxID=391612 RepID=A3II55_9CHRO|nr:hypothetical protein CY0110_16867 [Crocosphaera chwakensis CCY0110]